MTSDSPGAARPLLMILALAAFSLPALNCAPPAEPWAAETTDQSVVVRGPDGDIVLRYNRFIPVEDTALTTESGSYFHPVNTPSGIRVTGLNPEDHLYHRGIFFGWIDMQTAEQSADFWGWGHFAPRANRVIVNRRVSDVEAGPEGARFVSENEWMAGDTVMVRETLRTHIRRMEGANVLDLTYVVTPAVDITLPQRAFGGFVFRTRIDGEIRRVGPGGNVDLPAPDAMEPETNWPAQSWYAYLFDVPGIDTTFGAAVIDHPDNPTTSWHNQFNIGLLQPNVMGGGDVHLPAGEPVTLRYRAVTFDGELPTPLLNRLAAEWED